MIRFAENLNKMIAAGLGGALDPPRTEVSVGHRVVYTEASGAVVNFKTNVIAPVKTLRVTMEPIQDLHGYDAPWPAGGGKNLFDKNTVSTGSYDPTSGALNSYGIRSDYIKVTPGQSISENKVKATTNGQGEQTFFSSWIYFDSNKQFVSGTWNTSNTVTVPNNAEYLVVSTSRHVGDDDRQFAQSVVDTFLADYIIANGETIPTYSPYSNICPITGRDSVTVWREASYDPSADPALTIHLGQTVYGGTLDVSTGKLTVTHGEIASYNGEVLTGEWISDRDVYAAGTTPTIGAQVVYVLDTPQTIDLDPQQITTLIGDNNVWTDAGDVTLEYPYYEETEGY